VTDLLATIPATKEQASTETVPWSLDVTPLLADGETPSLPVVTLIDLASNEAYPTGLSGTPTLVGNVITQRVLSLQPGHVYRLVFQFQAAVGKVFSPAVILECPF
jgi:hypothetical protein